MTLDVIAIVQCVTNIQGRKGERGEWSQAFEERLCKGSVGKVTCDEANMGKV